MYSTSNSFLGGGNSSRPVPLQYGHSSFQGQPQPNGSTQQQTGFNGDSLQSHYTSVPGHVQQQSLQTTQQMPYYTGIPPSQQSVQNIASQQQSLPTGQPSQSQLAPQRTGQTSSQIAQSFQSPPSVQPTASRSSTTKIPKIRLSFLTVQDQAKFEQLFKSAVGDGQALDGDKVRDLLVRSKLPGSDLMQIWVLSDTTKSGQLLFPEFALAMYLCNLKLVGKELPQILPERVANEVSSMVDIISFGVPDDRPQLAPRSNVPNFDASAGAISSPSIQQPQPQSSNSQLLSQMTSQPTGFASQYIPPQPTGFHQQSTGFSPQQPSFQPQKVAFLQNPLTTSYPGALPPISSMPTGFGSALVQPQTAVSALPLNAQSTGRPGQWGLVNAPASGLPNIDALQQRMMPQVGREGGYTTIGLSGSATVPWAVTKDEKKIYDQLFKAWDGFNKGFIGGDVAIEVMGQSGLDKQDLEKIWTLSDPGNKGRLNMDEFAVAMHLIYRKLNGYPVPNKLPPELVPPSTRNFADSIGTVKSLLSQDAESRKNNGAFLEPQRTGISYLKNHSFRTNSNGATAGRKDATVFRNNDDDVGYKSSARRRLGAGGRTPSPVQPSSPLSEMSGDGVSSEQLRKKIREKQIMLDAVDFEDENAVNEDDALDRRDRREAEELFRRLQSVQEDIDSYPGVAFRNADSSAERRALKRQLQGLIDRIPEVVSHVRRIDKSIADAKLELFRLKDARAHPSSVSTISGTGPGGSVTEADRLKARAKAMMQQRSATLTGRPSATNDNDAVAAPKRLEAETLRIRAEKNTNEQMIKDVEESVRDFSRGLEDLLNEAMDGAATEHEKRRWEDGLGVEDEVKDFIFDLQRSSRSSKVRHDNSERGNFQQINPSQEDRPRDLSPAPLESSKGKELPLSRLAPASSSLAGSSYSSYKTAEERAAYIKQQAEQRMAERLTALGLKAPLKSAESAQQRQERERKEREDRVRQAEEEDMKRDHERQRRLADECFSPLASAKSSGKKPPPPPSRKSKTDSVEKQLEANRRAEGDHHLANTEQERKEKDLMDQQEALKIKTRDIENEAHRQEDEIAKESEAAQARLKALEEQVKQGKIRNKEEKRRKQTVEKEAKEKAAKLAAQRAELDAAKERERQLQLQLQSLRDGDSSDDEGPEEITPQETTPTNSQVLSKDIQPSAAESGAAISPQKSELAARSTTSFATQATRQPSSSPPIVQSTIYSSDTKNPFFKKLSISNDSSVILQPQPTSSITSTVPNEVSTNPFHRLTQQENAAKNLPPLSSTTTSSRPSRVRPEEDEWSVVDSTEDSSDDEDKNEKSGGGSAKQLASMLFGTMAPPPPQSAMDDKRSPATPIADQPLTPVAPPLAPPMPNISPPSGPPPALPMPGPFGANTDALQPPPPPPPMPSATGSNVAPPAVGALLGDIIKGKGLKKVKTKDRSQSSVAGRVLE